MLWDARQDQGPVHSHELFPPSYRKVVFNTGLDCIMIDVPAAHGGLRQELSNRHVERICKVSVDEHHDSLMRAWPARVVRDACKTIPHQAYLAVTPTQGQYLSGAVDDALNQSAVHDALNQPLSNSTALART